MGYMPEKIFSQILQLGKASICKKKSYRPSKSTRLKGFILTPKGLAIIRIKTTEIAHKESGEKKKMGQAYF